MSMAFSRKIIFTVGVYGVVKWLNPLTLVYNVLRAGYKARPVLVDVLKPECGYYCRDCVYTIQFELPIT